MLWAGSRGVPKMSNYHYILKTESTEETSNLLIAQEALLLEIGDMVGHDVVEGVVATLEGLLVGETGLLKQIDHHVGSGQLALLWAEWKCQELSEKSPKCYKLKTYRVEVDSDKLSESGRVVISDSFCISPSLKDRVSLDNLVLKRGFSFGPFSRGADGGIVGDDLLGVLSLSGTRLSGDKDGLVDAVRVHRLICGLSHWNTS